MPTIRPFRALRYDPSKAPLPSVVAPPYDVISPEQQERYYATHPNNVIRLILGREADRYAAAAATLKAWQVEHVLVRDAKPALYLLHQSFAGPNGTPITRKGFIALCRLEEFDKRIVLPHEKTLSKAKEDRFKLFQATNSNFSQVFSLYWDREKLVDAALNGSSRKPPTMEVTFEEVENKMWAIEDHEIVNEVTRIMADKQVLIADGHHRYETGLAYRDLMRSKTPGYTGNELFNYIMMFFCNLEDEGLVIYPTHRLVHSLPSFDRPALLKHLERLFLIREMNSLSMLQAALASASTRSFGMVCADGDKFWMASLKPTLTAAQVVPDEIPNEVKELDVTLLHTVVLRDLLGISAEAQEKKLNLDYVKGAEEAVEATRTGKAQLSFILNATKLEEVRSAARAGHVMPQKSTYFYPKLLSGLVLNLMAE
ncbi:MAG: DUF1015 domain-containing protein [Bacteroidetes bacterium]|jgi:uncharacterized protein (DUF1015 family)|nr:DUF1015 domain-containing protein [Bacteroidota bacterium]